MAIGTTSNFNQNRDEIISSALELVEVISPGDTPDADKVTTASAVLNRIVKALQAEGTYLWNTEWRQKTFFASSEVTGSDSKVYTCVRTHRPTVDTQPVTGANWTTYWVERGVTGGTWAASVSENPDAAAATDAGGGYVDIAIATHSILATDVVQIKGTVNYDGAYPIVSLPSANAIRITAPFVAETFTGDETIDTVYSAKGDFILPSDVLSIDQAFVRQNGTDYPVKIFDEIDYLNITDKASEGMISELFLKYKLQPEVFTYPQTELTTDVLHYLAVKKLKDFDIATDDPDFPAHWIDPLINELAYKLTFIFGNTVEKRGSLFAEANRLKKLALNFDKKIVVKDRSVRPHGAFL